MMAYDPGLDNSPEPKIWFTIRLGKMAWPFGPLEIRRHGFFVFSIHDLEASMNTKSTRGGTSDVMGDIDESASLEQVTKVYRPSAKNDVLAGMDIDENHGGVNDIVRSVDGAASSTKMTMYNCSSPTPEEMGIN